MKCCFKTLLWFLFLLPVAGSLFAQTGSAGNDAPDPRAASILFDEANTYVDKKFTEFNKQKISYDEKLDKKTRQEQKDLAAKYVTVLRQRGSLSQIDQFYVG